MRMRVLTTKLRVEIENETRVFLESLDFENEMRVSQKSGVKVAISCIAISLNELRIGLVWQCCVCPMVGCWRFSDPRYF